MEEIIRPKSSGKRNRNAGHSYERSTAAEFRDIGFTHVVTSRVESKSRDDAKIDIMNKDEGINGRLPYNVQCKCCSTSVLYPKILGEMPIGKEINVIFHKHTKREKNGTRFMTKGDYAILYRTDFMSMVASIKNITEAFLLLNDYFDFIPEDEKEEVNNKLKQLGV